MAKVVVFGAGKAGSRIVAEAARRGHAVTAVARNKSALTSTMHATKASCREAKKSPDPYANQEPVILKFPVAGSFEELIPNS